MEHDDLEAGREYLAGLYDLLDAERARVRAEHEAAAIAGFVAAEDGREGTCAVIGPPGVAGTVPAAATKGLEFDAVLVVSPERILADGPRGAAGLDVALTRATQRPGVLHREPLPPALAGLVRH